MTRIATPLPERGIHWALAGGLSILMHGAAIAGLAHLFVQRLVDAPRDRVETRIVLSEFDAPSDDVDPAAPVLAPVAAEVATPAERASGAAPPLQTLTPAAPANPAPPPQGAATARVDSVEDTPRAASAAGAALSARSAGAASAVIADGPGRAARADPGEAATVAAAASPAASPTAPSVSGIAERTTADAVQPDPLTPDPGTNLQTAGVATATSVAPADGTEVGTLPPAGGAMLDAGTGTASGPPPDADLQALVERIRAALDRPCLVALPRPAAQGGAVPVTILSDDAAAADAFAADAFADLARPVEAQPVAVDARQCPALNTVRAQQEYPVFALNLQVDATNLTSGQTLSGAIEGAGAGAYTTLVLVDDNGVVQDLQRFLRFTGGRATFAIPVTRDGPARPTALLLIAMATPVRPDALARLDGRSAEDVFPALEDDLDDAARIAVAAFSLQ
ncbi:hypothetical protein [Jannaschia sp. LMIT008]|uniref:hypothetical protein n=1 Tax=Jannaschia maritima TaxID=3032585 RepID=UPI002810AF5B|nr:hypothetical protein [Jannaschia sp. LMIT008]